LPSLPEPAAQVLAGRVLVDGSVVTNPRSLVAVDASIRVLADRELRGEAKLRAGLEALSVPVAGRVALDVGAAAGGFTAALLAAGARRVYAVDAGSGQLAGRLRQDPRVVDLEGTNLGALDRTVVPDAVALVTLDLSYLSLARAVPQLEALDLADDAHLLALVKPQFELGLARAPRDGATLDRALVAAATAIGAGPWLVLGTARSPVRGAGGAIESFVHARRDPAPRSLAADPPLR
jgi:23S rRNA (cytidine1920-2'-O)/16S rRNA (cytidine1409-2'-O)-methyltransferase